MRVLLVEDTDTLRHLFARMLQGNGFEVREAADGGAALRCLSDFVPELVLTDLMMPGIDGYELIRRLKAMPCLEAVPVVAMTACATSEAEREARRAGAADFLAKPVDCVRLLACLGGYSWPDGSKAPSLGGGGSPNGL
jgi:CheY-like chemotaxis protein